MHKVCEVMNGLFVDRHIRRLFGRGTLKRFLRKKEIHMVVATVPPHMKKVKEAVAEYVYCPVLDGKLEKKEYKQLERIAVKAAEAVKKNKPVLLYCNRGKNRSCLVAALTISNVYGISGKSAMEIVRRNIPNALDNKHFVKYLRAYGNHN